MIFFIRKILGLKTKAKPDDASEQNVREHCPICRSQNIAIQFSGKDADKNVVQQRGSGGCVTINSGSIKRICQDCTCVWDEEEFDTPACLMMKPTKRE